MYEIKKERVDTIINDDRIVMNPVVNKKLTPKILLTLSNLKFYMKQSFFNKFLVIVCSIAFLFVDACNKDDIENISNAVIENRLIYGSDSEYCAFCDIVYFRSKYYLAFRIGPNHQPVTDSITQYGYIKIMSSTDTYNWIHELDIVDNDWDLRDPCFCINGINELTLNYGVHRRYSKPEYKNFRVVFDYENNKLSIKKRNQIDIGVYSNYWIWKTYFHDNRYWGVGYLAKESPILVSSEDGINYKLVSTIPDIEGEETALVFDGDNLLAFQRNVTQYEDAYISSAKYPYDFWNVTQLNRELSGPEACVANGDIFIAARGPYGVSVYVYNKDKRDLSDFLNLFANGTYSNRGYTGMVYVDNYLNIVYYSCNDFSEMPSIYLTRVKLK